MPKSFYNKHPFAVKWITLAVIIKSALFILFAFNFIQNWPARWVVNSIFIVSGDTYGYYDPVESFVNGTGYNTFCRMPGLLPIYAPLYFIFGSVWGKTIVIVLQLLFGAFSVYFLARAAEIIFKNRSLFYITFFLYAFSSFVSIWDHYGYSDSFSTSFLIFSFYLFVSYLHTKKIRPLVLSGSFLAWSVFFRPVNLMVFGFFLFILFVWQLKQFRSYVKHAFLFILPFLIVLIFWSCSNYYKYNKIILLQGSFSECYGGALAEDHLAIRNLIIAWGGDFQEWALGAETEWFFTKHGDLRNRNPFKEEHYTQAYTLDSLIYLKTNYDSVRTNSPLNPDLDAALRHKTIAAAQRFHASYVAAHPLKYYLFNRLTFLRRFVFPSRLDNLPFPKFSEMHLYQKVMKLGYLMLLNFITTTGLIGMFLGFSGKNIFQLIPLCIVVTLACILGFVEQRYLVPAYPFFCIYSAYFIFVSKARFLRFKAR